MMEIRIDMNIKPCPYCFGSGSLKAMQTVVADVGSIRGKDTQVNCKYCKGTGLVK